MEIVTVWPAEDRDIGSDLCSQNNSDALRTAKTGRSHRHTSNKQQLFLTVGIICIMNIPLRKSPLDGEDSCYLVAKERHSNKHCNKIFLFPFNSVCLSVQQHIKKIIIEWLGIFKGPLRSSSSSP